jgi:hypothetical protein
MQDTAQAAKATPEAAAVIENADFGTMVVMPGVAGEAVLFGYANPEVYKAALLNFNLRTMKAIEMVGRDFCSLRLHYGLSRTIATMRQTLQDEGHDIGAAYLASLLHSSLLSRTADDISIMFTMTLPNVIEGEDTTLPLSPMHLYTIFWMAQAVAEDLLTSVDGEDQSFFSEQRLSMDAAKDVMSMLKPIWDKFQGDANPALHMISFREGLTLLKKTEAGIEKEQAAETAAA